jgi:hypothetical protein
MCLACEEADLFYRWQLLQQIAKGVMPEGVTEAELRAMGLPLPDEVELVDEPDGTKILRQKAPAKAPNKKFGERSDAKPVPTFAERAPFCDSPDE